MDFDTSPEKSTDQGSLSVSRRKAIASVAALSATLAMPAFAQKKEKAAGAFATAPDGYFPSVCSINKPGISRQFTTFDPTTKVKAHIVKPGEKRDLINYDKAGIITRLWITFSGWFWEYWNPGAEVDATILKKFILRIYWDGNSFPSVEAPLGDFFGIGQCEYKHYLSQYMGMSSGGFYCYFPMPFSKGIRLEVENMHDTAMPSIFLNANYQALTVLPEGFGRFHCLYNAGDNAGPEPLTLLKASGKGHFVGCCLSIQARDKNHLSYLESNEYFYIDTDTHSSPAIVGTGMEDYFNGGWYFRNGEFAGQFHGVPIKDALRSMVTMYRSMIRMQLVSIKILRCYSLIPGLLINCHLLNFLLRHIGTRIQQTGWLFNCLVKINWSTGIGSGNLIINQFLRLNTDNLKTESINIKKNKIFLL